MMMNQEGREITSTSWRFRAGNFAAWYRAGLLHNCRAWGGIDPPQAAVGSSEHYSETDSIPKIFTLSTIFLVEHGHVDLHRLHLAGQ